MRRDLFCVRILWTFVLIHPLPSDLFRCLLQLLYLIWQRSLLQNTTFIDTSQNTLNV